MAGLGGPEKGRFVAWSGHREDGLWEDRTVLMAFLFYYLRPLQYCFLKQDTRFPSATDGHTTQYFNVTAWSVISAT
jgi:hypothetical protein